MKEGTPAARVLVIRLGSLGDVVLTEPAVRALKAARPDDEVHFLTKEHYAGLVGLFRDVDRVISTGPGTLSATGLAALTARLRANRYDLVVDLHGNLRSRAVALGVGARRRLSYPKAGLKRRLMPYGFFRHPGVDHTVLRYLAALEPLHISHAALDTAPTIDPGHEARTRAQADLQAAGWDGEAPLVAIMPGARWPSKRWPIENFARVIEGLRRERGTWAVILGDGQDTEAARQLAAEVPEGVADLVGKTDLVEMTAVLSLARLAVTNDSGPMHLAAAVGARVLAVFGPTTPALGFHPVGPGHRVFEVWMSCRPCSVHGKKPCRHGDLRCLTGVAPTDVLAEALATFEEETA